MRVNVAILVATMAWAGAAGSADDEFTQTVNYVFSGNIEGKTPQLLSGVEPISKLPTAFDPV